MIGKIPLFHREIALQVVEKKAAQNAIARGASSVEEEDIVASLLNGANSYVRKPVDFGRFVEQVQRLQVYWLLVHEPLASR